MVERYRHYQPNRQKQVVKKKPPRRKKGWVVILLSVAILSFFGFKQLQKGEQEPPTKKQEAVVQEKKKPELKQVSQASWDQIKHVVDIASDANPDLDISLSLVDVKTGVAKDFGVQTDFAAASTTKVLTAVAYLHNIELGEATLEESVGGLPAERQLKQMINQSNNESWSALNSAVGAAELEAYARSIGMESYVFAGNTLKTKDQTLLLAKLAKGELINSEHRKLLYSYMQDTNNEDMIPGAVPAGASLYHKYGQLDDRLHDCAIIDYKNRPLAITVFTKGTPASGRNYNVHTKLIESIAQNAIDIFYQDL